MNTIEKPKKKKGPIRFEAIVPFFIIVALIVAYFTLFFDSHLKWAIEYGATYANGAEVNVQSVETSFTRGDFAIKKIEVTSLANPSKNSVEIGNIHFKFLWDALLRAKYVIEDASITSLQINTPRKSPGRITQREDPDLAKEKEDSKGSALADAERLLGGVIDLKGIENTDNLHSVKKVSELQTDLTNKQKEWTNSLQSLPTTKDLSDLQSRISSAKVGGTSNPSELQQQVQNIEGLIREANEKVTSVKTKGESIRSGVNGFNSSLKGLDDVIQQDIKDLEARVKIPKLDVASLSMQFFGPGILLKIEQAKRYMMMARKYMPPSKKDDKEKMAAELEPTKRGEGETFQFPITTGYPLFWLKRAALSSKAENSPFGGDILGEIRDVCSKPSQIRKPTLITLKGNFPAQDIIDVSAQITLDHTKDISEQKIHAAVGAFPVLDRMLSESESLKFGFKKATGATSLDANLKGDEISITSKSTFGNVDYAIAAQSEQMTSLLKTALADSPTVTVDANVKGTLADMRWEITSNLAGELQKGFEKQLKAKVDEARAQIQKVVDEKIGAQKKQLTDQYASTQNQVNAEIAERTKAAEKVKSDAEAKLADAKSKATNQGQKALDELKNQIKF